jgi:hypothetical protein
MVCEVTCARTLDKIFVFTGNGLWSNMCHAIMFFFSIYMVTELRGQEFFEEQILGNLFVQHDAGYQRVLW